jgi:anti-sigma factor RsiW
MLELAIDGRLGAEEQAALDRHLADCEACRRELDLLRWTKGQAAAARERGGVPADLEARILAALDGADALPAGLSPAAPPSADRPPSARRWAIGGLAAAAALVLLAWGLLRAPALAIPDAVARDHRAYVEAALPLAIRTADVARIDAYFTANGIGFRPRVYDLGMMQYTALGGVVHRVAGRPSALFVYAGPDGRVLLCQMYEGTLTELPAPDERRTDRGVEFLIYRREAHTLVFWREPDGVVCVLAGDGAPGAVIALAVAKATRP